MPFKLKLIKQLQKNIRCIKDQEEATEKLQIIKDEHAQQKQKSRQKKKIIFKNYSMFHLILTKEPIQQQHVINFYNILGINQKAIKDPTFDQSFVNTVFYLKNVKKVEIRTNVVVLHMINIPMRCPPIEHIIERFKSFGDSRFYNLANVVFQAFKRLKTINQMVVNQNTEENNDFLQKYIEQMGNKMYTCRLSTQMVFSKSFLQALQFNAEDFALDCVRHKACLHQFISTQPYFDVIYRMIENLRNLFDLLSDKISLQTFLDSSVLRFKDFMFTKNYKKVYCKLKVGMPNPMVNLLQIEEILNRSEEIFDQNGVFKKKKIQTVKQQRQLAEINNIRKVIKLPKNLLPQNNHLVTQYDHSDALPKVESSIAIGH